MQRYLSRKLILSIVTIILNLFIPILFKSKGIDDSVTLMVLGTITGLAGSYHLANVVDSKNNKEV